MSIREERENIEKMILSPSACLSVASRGRQWEEPECDIRTCFARDRDRILHSKSFRRLKHKTQVLLLPEGDHYRTRLTHTLEVSQIARTISRALRLNEDLTEAIALGHDLGHTPFGHIGERVLDKLAKAHGLSGFHHAEQSLRVVDCLERDGRGLNLTWEVRMGIIQHSKGQVSVKRGYNLDKPSTLEAWVVRISDSLAYVNHDTDDALRAGFINIKDLDKEEQKLIEIPTSDRIEAMVKDVVSNSTEHEIRMSEPMLAKIEALRHFLHERVYKPCNSEQEVKKVSHIITELFLYRLNENEHDPREAVDYISGMTDRFAINFFKKHFVPEPFVEC